jgi:phosphonate transport system ATP-binding protein
VIGLRAGRVVMDAPVLGLSRDQAMALYSKLGAVPASPLAAAV